MDPNLPNLLIVGIDPGLHGAIAKLWVNAETKAIVRYEIIDIPILKLEGTAKHEYNIPAFNNVMQYIESDESVLKFIYTEKIHAMPAQGSVSTWNMGFGFGLLRGLMAARKFNVSLITPQAWKKAEMAGMPKDKGQSVIRAQEVFPDAVLTTPRGKALDGRGDAMLIAYYAYRAFHL